MGNRGRAGFTLVEIAVAAGVFGIAIIGSFSLITAVQSHNQSFSDSRLATKACQEVMELVLLDSHNYTDPADWENKWNHLGIGGNDGRFFTPRIHPIDSAGNFELGRVRIRDISGSVALPNHSPAPPTEKFFYEVTVSVEGKDRAMRPVTLRPLFVSLISRRSFK